MLSHEKRKTIDVLNTLAEINNDRIEGYEKASAITEERAKRSVFKVWTNQQKMIKSQLDLLKADQRTIKSMQKSLVEAP